MVLGRSSRYVPNLLKPAIKLFFVDFAGFALRFGRFPISSGLPLHEYEFHIIFDNRVGFIRFAEEFRAIRDLIGGIGDFVPDNRIEVVKPDPPTNHADVCMQRKHEVPPEVAAGDTDISNHTNQPPSRHKDAEYMLPDFLQFFEKRFVVLNVAELIRVFMISFKIPIWRRCDNQMA